MKVLYVCSELFPLLKTGGLADVSAALPAALLEAGCDVRFLLPGFPAIVAGVVSGRGPLAMPLFLPKDFGPALGEAGGQGGVTVQRCALAVSDVPAYILQAPGLLDRPGNPYLDAQGKEWPDNALRFALLGWAAACLGGGLDADWQPDIVHCHDWHTGLAPAYLRCLAPAGAPVPASVFTVHNLAYQGLFPRASFGQLGLPAHLFGIDGVEFYDQVSFMKAGLQFADQITTVSPTYAREILTPEQGCGLDGLLRARSDVLSGILNGVDYLVWNPAHDEVLDKPYDWRSLGRKARAKAQLQASLGLELQPDALLFGVVSRLSEQKGLHLVEAVMDALVHKGGQLALLGGGDAALEQAFVQAAHRHPGRVAVHLGYNESLGHQVIAGADVILVPSRYEPCGLTQLYGMRYGTVPLVHRVGGLADTVADISAESLAAGSACGIVFDGFSASGLQSALDRAFALYAQPEVWKSVQRNGMQLRFDWQEAAQRYLALYRRLRPAR
jgi:starch synthase